MAGKIELFSVKDTHGLPFRPVEGWLPAPRRRPPGDLVGGQRPVVALVDTGVDTGHPWFAGGEDDPIVVDAAWRDHGGEGRGWHGTFVAGLIHKNGPDARILSLQLAQTEFGYIQDDQLRAALKWLLNHHHGGGRIDVVCIPMGFRRDAATHDDTYIDEVAALITELSARGVTVLAAAGNKPVEDSAGSGPVYPAASANTGTPLTAVGALTPSGDHWADSLCGIDGMVWYPGDGVVSTAPTAVALDGFTPDSTDDLGADVHYGELPPEQVGLRFGVGSGTSYAVGGYAGCVAQSIALGVPVASLLAAGPEPEDEQA